MANPAKEYALYKGDKLLAMGTKKEIMLHLIVIDWIWKMLEINIDGKENEIYQIQFC